MWTKFKFLFTTLLVLLCLSLNISIAEGSTQATINISPVADTYVRSEYPNTNYGSAVKTDVVKSPSHIAYYKFDLTSLAGQKIDKANLSLHVANATKNLLEIRPVTDTSWQEKVITYKTRPAVGSTITSFFATATGTKNIDLTSYFASNAGKVVTFALNGTGNNNLTVNSKEALLNKPFLTITTSSSDVPTSTPSPTATLTPIPTATVTPQPVNMEIYSDSLADGWESWSWDSTINFADSAPVYKGTKSIKFASLAPWSGLDIHNPNGLNTTNYPTVHFALQAQSANSQYAVYLTDNTDVQLTAPQPLTNFGGNPVAGNWKVYDIPLSSLNAGNKTITGIVIHDISGVSSSVVYVDDVLFSQNAVTLPTPNPTIVPTPTPVITPVITNNVPNNSVEQTDFGGAKPLSWNANSWGENTAAFAYLSTGHTGNRSVQTTITGYSSGDAKWYYDAQPVIPSQQYIFSDYYKSDTTSRVVIEFTSTNDAKTYYELRTAPASSDWAFYQDSFMSPVDAKSMTVFHLLASVGFLITDDYQVAENKSQGFNRSLVSLTFDDGWQSQFTSGKPMLTSTGLPATFYISTGLLNTENYMTDSMVASLRDSGDEIANHTVSHPRLLSLSDEQINTEFRDSQDYLSSHFGTQSLNFASPYGETDERVINIAKQYFKSHRGVINGYNYKDNFDIYHLKVQNILITTTDAEVQSWLSQAAQEKSWLILVYHAVDDNADQYGVTPANFQSQLDIVKQSGLPVMTVDQALSEIQPQLAN